MMSFMRTNSTILVMDSLYLLVIIHYWHCLGQGKELLCIQLIDYNDRQPRLGYDVKKSERIIKINWLPFETKRNQQKLKHVDRVLVAPVCGLSITFETIIEATLKGYTLR